MCSSKPHKSNNMKLVANTIPVSYYAIIMLPSCFNEKSDFFQAVVCYLHIPTTRLFYATEKRDNFENLVERDKFTHCFQKNELINL